MSKMSKHTPGPWKFVPSDDTPGHREPAVVYIKNKRFEFSGGIAFDAHETEANARLISASPDLLAACKVADQFLDHLANSWEVCRHTQAMIDQIKAAIAKAEGRL